MTWYWGIGQGSPFFQHFLTISHYSLCFFYWDRILGPISLQWWDVAKHSFGVRPLILGLEPISEGFRWSLGLKVKEKNFGPQGPEKLLSVISVIFRNFRDFAKSPFPCFVRDFRDFPWHGNGRIPDAWHDAPNQLPIGKTAHCVLYWHCT